MSLPHRADARIHAGRLARAALAALAVVVAGACRPSAPLPDTDAPLALLDVPTLAGERFDPASLDGQVVVVNFWSPG